VAVQGVKVEEDMMEFKKYIELIALTHAIGNGKSIHEWCPFAKGDTLDTIIESHNDRCFQSYQEQWKGDFISTKTYGEGIRVDPHDLSTLDDIPDREYFDNIRIILIDLDTIGEEELERIKKYFTKDVFVAQVSRTLPTRLIDMGAPFYSDPEVMVDQETLEKWLTKFCKAYRDSIKEGTTYIASKLLSLRSKEDLATITAYLEALPEVAATVRDATIKRGLSEEKTVTLAHQAVVQEFALSRIEVQVLSQPNFNRVLLDAIREPVVDMPIELGFQSPALQQVNLVELHVTQPMYVMTTEQCNIVRGFGIKEDVETFAAVLPDQPNVWDNVERLKGVAKATKFSAELPIGLRSMR
jgi:hypothetical protein